MKETTEDTGKILIYQNEKGETKIDVYFSGDTVWMTQKALAELYQVTVPTINEHIKNIYTERELEEGATIRQFLIVQNEGSRTVERKTNYYNFEMILAVGYRVRSSVGSQFRNWASKILQEYAQKGFAMNDERLKNPQKFGQDYFDELLERIRDIRSSERRFYQKICDIYATSVDYAPESNSAQEFFATVQNKLHYSVHGHTAAEIIYDRADASKDNMGLTSFKGKVVRKTDVDTAKNYLTKDELEDLNRIVSMYLDYAEDQAKRHIPMHMKDWETKLNGFLEFNGRSVLTGSGQISRVRAKQHAEEQYGLFAIHRKEVAADSEETDDFTGLCSRIQKDTPDGEHTI
ncbi:MAG: virulence RhuM family protein [Treponema sp.]|nr:virulence RhuM family protein [Treponema sp.]